MDVATTVKIVGGCLLVARLINAGEPSGAVEGTVTFNGEIPKSVLPDDSGQRDPLIAVHPKSKGLRDVVVYLKSAQVLRHSSERLPAAKMDQVNNRFVPHVLAVRAGAPVLFTNSDSGNHNVRASSSIATNEFNIFTGVDGSYRRAFAADPNGQAVRVGCDIHPWMRGWIYVFDDPLFAVSDGEGRFKISGVPPGEYEVMLMQPDLGYRERKRIRVRAGKSVTMNTEARAR